MVKKRQCPGCSGQYAVKKDGRLWAHANDMSDLCTQEAPVSDPAPTVDVVDDTKPYASAPCGIQECCGDDDVRDDSSPGQCSEPKCTCGGHGGPEHELALIGAFDDPTSNDADQGAPEKGPWFSAMYSGECSAGYCVIEEGDWIRADGQGGYECEDCGEDDLSSLAPMTNTYQKQASAAARRHQALATSAAEGPSGDVASDVFQREQDAAAEYLANAHGSMGGADLMDPGPHAHSYADAVAAPVVELRIPASRGSMPTPEEFMDPRQVTYPGMEPSVIPTKVPTPEEFMDPSSVDDPADKLNVSGQPNARYEWYGSQNRGYLVKEPHTGDFRRYKNGKPKGLTRATTFNKAASDSKAINDWGKRNIVIGASRRPNILLRAHGLTHENDRRELEGIVAELEEAAGAKVGSELGTYLHEFTEQMDAGLKTWRDAPPEYQRSLVLYADALGKSGLEPVPGLIERTTMITEYGGVVGTFDRIFYHRPSGTYIVGDLKTGKTMEYAMNETETQMWVYAHGVNQNGVYDWNTDTWERAWPDMSDKDPDEYSPIKVREDVGVIIHMPVQGPLAGQVVLDHADLQAGARHAELCHRNRTAPRSKVRPFEPPLPARPLTWEERFALVTSSEHATQLWREAKAAGIAGVRLNELVSVARQALADKG